LASGVAGAADKFLMPPAGMNTLRFQNGITIEIPDNWILLQSKINLFNAARHDDKGNAFAFLIIQKINASLPVTHDDIRKMSDSVKKNFLDSFVESYQKSQNMSSEIQDRKILASDIIELKESKFYSGPIDSAINGHRGGFVDIIKIGAPPPKEMLWRSLFLKPPCAAFVVE